MRHPPVFMMTAALIATLSLSHANPSESVAVRIDGTIEISSAELNTFVDAKIRSQGVPPDQQASVKAQAWDQAVEQLVTQKLLVRAADTAEIAVSDDDVQAFFKERLPEGVTVSEVAAREGVPEEKLFADVKANLRINKLIEAQMADVTEPTEEELQKVFAEISERYPDYIEAPEQVEARHILLKVEPGSSEEDRAKARTKIEDIRRRIVEGGEDFAALAAEHSDCPSGKRGGGNLGMFGRGQMVKPFEDAAFGQEIGKVGDVVSTDFGFHVIEVVQRKEAAKRTLESEREQLKGMAMQRKKGALANAYIEKLKEGVKVEVLETAPLPPPVDAGAEPRRELPVWAQ